MKARRIDKILCCDIRPLAVVERTRKDCWKRNAKKIINNK